MVNPFDEFCYEIVDKESTVLGKTLTRANEYDAGLDIVGNEDKLIRAHSKEIIKTGIKVHIPKNYVGILKSRSGLAAKHSIHVGAGVIDSGYTAEWKVILYNHGDVDYQVTKGDRIAQLLLVPIALNVPFMVESMDEFIGDVTRGESGFGSSGN